MELGPGTKRVGQTMDFPMLSPGKMMYKYVQMMGFPHRTLSLEDGYIDVYSIIWLDFPRHV